MARVGGEASGRGAPGSYPRAPVQERDAPAAARPPTVRPQSPPGVGREGVLGGAGRGGVEGAAPLRVGGGGGRRRRERARPPARPPYVSEDGVRSTPRVEGGVHRVHSLTRSSADKGHLEAEATTARAAQPPAGRQTPAPPALRARLRPLGPVQRSSAHRLAVSPSRPSVSQTPQDCTRAGIWGVVLDEAGGGLELILRDGKEGKKRLRCPSPLYLGCQRQ